MFVLLAINGLRGNSCDRRSHLAVRGVKMLDVLTNKLDCLVEPGADIGFVVVLDRDALVEVGVLKVVWTVGRDVDESGDPQHVKHVFSRSMVSAAKVQERQDLHWTALCRGKINKTIPFSELQNNRTGSKKHSFSCSLCVIISKSKYTNLVI